MPIALPDGPILTFYLNLAGHLNSGDLSPSEVEAEIRSKPVQPTFVTAIEHLRMDAETSTWYAPRRSWARAYVAYLAAQKGAQDLLRAQCNLTLAITLNVLGHFAHTLSYLPFARKHFKAYSQPIHVSRCDIAAAMAYVYRGQFEAAQRALAYAQNFLALTDDSLVLAHYEWAEGIFYLEQNRYPEATKLFHQAGNIFMASGHIGEAALVWCDLVIAMRYLNPNETLNWLERVCQISPPEESPIHTARCEYIRAVVYEEQNRYSESLDLYRKAYSRFIKEDMRFWAARCARDQGIVHHHLNQYEEALQAYKQAQTSFKDQELNAYVATCNLNIAIIYRLFNRYAKALDLYQQVLKEALAEKRTLRAARCYTNMGVCYHWLGRYDKALSLHNRAREAFLATDSPIYAAHCQENLAETYRALGRYDLALTHYQAALETFINDHLTAYAAHCNMQMAALHLALDRPAEAQIHLTKARRTYQEMDIVISLANCDRLLAQLNHALQKHDEGLSYLNQARQVFIQQNILVESALCDLVEGEIKLDQEEIRSAKRLFQRAGRILMPGLPDQAWRVEEGLGRCALAKGQKQIALNHYIAAINFINQARDFFSTEQLSSDFFAARQHIFEIAVKLALDLEENELALRLVEATKTRSFLAQHQYLHLLHTDRKGDPYLAQLIVREGKLRRQLEILRKQLKPEDGRDKLLADNLSIRNDQIISLRELDKLHQEYEQVIEQLRLLVPSAAMIHPAPFASISFREAAATHLSGKWVCLTYFLTETTLVIFFLDAQSLRVYTHRLSVYDWRILAQCTNLAPEWRELVYRGTIRGFSPLCEAGRIYRQHLGQLLLPPEIWNLTEEDLLILAPYGPLHSLPFHALLSRMSPLISRVPVIYVPSLPALQALWDIEAVETIGTRSLICGLEAFDGRAQPLPYAYKEIRTVASTFKKRCQILQGAEATTSKLKALSSSGELAHYDLIHFSTHAVVEPEAPMLSRVLLADDDLLIAEIFALQLKARLVTLSTCQAAVGVVKPGDEMMTLARAFFYAGAQAVMASMWEVEDETTELLMQHFYQHLLAGASIPQALRQAQLAMHQAGYAAYQWAPFIAIGRP